MLRMLGKWRRDDRAVVAIEVGILMPVMLMMMMIVIDAGNAILTNQKLINSVQTVGDLLAREDAVSTVIINDAIEAGKLAMMPYAIDSFGVDIVGVQFNGGPTKPTLIWRQTVNMQANQTIVADSAGLGNDKEGVIGVTIVYTFQPRFSGIFTGPFKMQEISYSRGRNGLFIPKV